MFIRLSDLFNIHSPSKHLYDTYKRQNICPNCPDVLYICDGDACDPCHKDYCHHTQDVRHAKNFKRVETKTGTYYEEVQK